MSSFTLQGLLLSLLLLANVAIAGRYSFTIQEVSIGVTRDWREEDLTLALVSTAGGSNIVGNSTWLVGEVHKGQTIATNDTVKYMQEFDITDTASNLSVAIGGFNIEDADEERAWKLVEGLVAVAAMVPGPQTLPAALFSTVLGFLDNPTDCTGPVIVGKADYTPEVLNNLEQNQQRCDSQSFEYDVGLLCAPSGANSSYTVKYCLERLDAKAKSAATTSSPSLAALVTALTVAIIYSGL